MSENGPQIVLYTVQNSTTNSYWINFNTQTNKGIQITHYSGTQWTTLLALNA